MFQKNKIDYATIKNILDELKRVGHIDFDETIYGQWKFEKVPIMPIIPFEGGAVISEYLDTSSSNINFGGISKEYNKVQFSGTGSGAYIVTGSNRYAETIIDAGRKVQFTNGATQTIAKLTSNGTPDNKVTIQSTTAGSQATINYTGTGTPFIPNAVLKDINFSVPVYALNGTNLGNNTAVKYVWNVAKKTMVFQ